MAGRDWKDSLKQTLTTVRKKILNENAPSVEEDLKKLPFYSLVPKQPLSNLAYRQTLLELADEDPELQLELWIASKRDILFFTNVFLWVFEPREAIVLPFITWPYQDKVLLQTDKAIGREDCGIEKSRDMGASWMFLTNFFYRWLFFKYQVFGLVSRNQDTVDGKDDPDTLMWKLDFHYKNLPRWMQPELYRVKLQMKNLELESTITGYSATDDVARGGRKTAFGMDEIASWGVDNSFKAWSSTQHVTNSRIMPSTPRGMAGVFADSMRNDNGMLKISIHWSEHPKKQPGLYHSVDGVVRIIDTEYPFPPDYPFVLDGKLRSPWYDRECKRHPIPALIAQELDIDYGGSGFPFFNAKTIEDHAKMFGCDPYLVGDLEFDADIANVEFRPTAIGSLKLWLHLDGNGQPPHNVDYVIGCDVATGTATEGASNSVASVINTNTGEKVAEWAANFLSPHKFAEMVVALRRWFRGPKGIAFTIWELNGPGTQFAKRFLELNSARIFYREASNLIASRTNTPGFFSNRETKRVLLGKYARGLEGNYMINRSLPAMEECLHYVFTPEGAVEHDRAKSTIDPTAAGDNHGDRVIADALAWYVCGSAHEVSQRKEVLRPPIGSIAWRITLKARKPTEQWL
jgi:hypothetical protein